MLQAKAEAQADVGYGIYDFNPGLPPREIIDVPDFDMSNMVDEFNNEAVIFIDENSGSASSTQEPVDDFTLGENDWIEGSDYIVIDGTEGVIHEMENGMVEFGDEFNDWVKAI